MKYTVKWSAIAEEFLAAIWLNSQDRNRISQAAFRIDSILASSPLEFGESRESTTSRVGHYLPIGISYQIIEDDKKSDRSKRILDRLILPVSFPTSLRKTNLLIRNSKECRRGRSRSFAEPF